MPKFGGRTRLISVGGVVLAGLAAVVGVVIFGSPAGAHTADLTGAAACQDDGTFTITYTGHTMRSDLASNITVTGSEPAGTTITPNGLQNVPGNSEFQLTQSGVPATADGASLAVHVVWTDGFEDNASASVFLPTDCTANATPTAPAFTDGSCAAPDSTYVIPDVKGVNYQVNGNTVAAGSYQAQPGDAITITAVAQQGYVLKGDTTWSHTFATLPTSCAGAPTATQPSCTSAKGSYTIPATDGVTYFVNGNETKAGTYTAKPGSTIKVNAFGSDGHALPGTSSWTLKIGAAPTDCTAHVPTFVDNTCTLSGSYTIPDTGADYTVNDVAVAPGKHSASAGSTITVRAVARAGHALTGTTSWTHSFPNLPQCTPVPPHSGSGQLPNTGPDVPVGKAGLLAGLLALIGTAMLFAGRRPNAPGRHSAS